MPTRSSSFKTFWHCQDWQLILRINEAARRMETDGESRVGHRLQRPRLSKPLCFWLQALKLTGISNWWQNEFWNMEWVFFIPNSSWSCPRNTDLTCWREKKKNQGQSNHLLTGRRGYRAMTQKRNGYLRLITVCPSSTAFCVIIISF